MKKQILAFLWLLLAAMPWSLFGSESGSKPLLKRCCRIGKSPSTSSSQKSSPMNSDDEFNESDEEVKEFLFEGDVIDPKSLSRQQCLPMAPADDLHVLMAGLKLIQLQPIQLQPIQLQQLDHSASQGNAPPGKKRYRSSCNNVRFNDETEIRE